MIEFFDRLWPHIAAALTFLLAVIASVHAILKKQDVRATIGWVGIIWLVPVVGPVLYGLLGINRIRRRATELRREQLRLRATTSEMEIPRAVLVHTLPPHLAHLSHLSGLVDRVTRRVLTTGNCLTPLVNGEEAFPAMLQAIEAAEQSVVLCTYIFDHDAAGRQFADALGRAVARGVQVRVLIDGTGARYSRPTMVGALEERGVRVARFLRTVVPWRIPYFNLRNHRKILVIDGTVGFTGGMNIRVGNLIERLPRSPVQDIHFRVEGPVVTQMANVFAEDWMFTTKEVLEGPPWIQELAPAGQAASRGISDGPDEDLDKLSMVILGALMGARKRIRVVTPYFLPDPPLENALKVAALRGVDVEIVLPEVNNLPFVKWASTPYLGPLMEDGCRVVMTPGPFDHSKLMVVDGGWTLIGSANWDPRSFRLNFEFNVECYDEGLASAVERLIDRKTARARVLSPEDVSERSLPVQLRDGIARLFSPYL